MHEKKCKTNSFGLENKLLSSLYSILSIKYIALQLKRSDANNVQDLCLERYYFQYCCLNLSQL